jgi:hypothetical protein
MAAAGGEAGIGASVNSALRQVGGAITVAVLGSVLRLWANQIAAQQLILQALGAGQRDPRSSFQDKVTVAACLAAASTAVLTWVENDGSPELPDLIEAAFDTLTHPG